MLLPTVSHERERLDPDPTYRLPPSFVTSASSSLFLDIKKRAEYVFEFICRVISVFDSNYASISTSFAAYFTSDVI